MKRPKQLPAVDRNSTRSASTGVPGVHPSKLVGKQPSPACRALAGYGCHNRAL
jgi:hypothetical protein